MKNTDKAIELSNKFKCITIGERCKNIEDACLKMAAWKERQTIEYLYKNIQILLKDYGVSEASADLTTQLFLVNFKRAMEE